MMSLASESHVALEGALHSACTLSQCWHGVLQHSSHTWLHCREYSQHLFCSTSLGSVCVPCKKSNAGVFCSADSTALRIITFSLSLPVQAGCTSFSTWCSNLCRHNSLQLVCDRGSCSPGSTALSMSSISFVALLLRLKSHMPMNPEQPASTESAAA